MKTLIATHGGIFVTGLIYIYRKHGVLPSISDSYYAFRQNWFFTIYMCLCGAPLIPSGNGWYFFAGAFLCFVGIAANFKEKLPGRVHVYAVAGAIFCGLGGLAVDQIYFPLVIVVLSGLLHVFKVKNATWWVEIICFAAIQSGLWTQIAINEGLLTR